MKELHISVEYFQNIEKNTFKKKYPHRHFMSYPYAYNTKTKHKKDP